MTTNINRNSQKKTAQKNALKLKASLEKSEQLLRTMLEDKYISSIGVSGKCNFVTIPDHKKNKLTIKFNVEVTGPLDTFL